jgi:hypothetical protein
VKRSANAGSAARDSGRIFNATNRSSFGCRALKTKPIPPWPIFSRISSCGKAAERSSIVGGTLFEGVPAPASVAMDTSAKRHVGQSPCGASEGIPAPHLGHVFNSDLFSILFPEALTPKGYILAGKSLLASRGFHSWISSTTFS